MDVSNCNKLSEGKTKIIYELTQNNNYVLVKSKDAITAFNAKRRNEIEGKAELSNKATCRVFQYLDSIGKCYIYIYIYITSLPLLLYIRALLNFLKHHILLSVLPCLF